MYIKILLCSFILIPLLSFAPDHKSVEPPPIHQLRIYTVPKQNREVFHERFRDHAQRIMKKYNFHIVAMWESVTDEKVEFVYLLEWKDKKTMEESWKNFMADLEWKDIKKRTSELHGTYVENIEDRTLILTDYSPRQSLLNK